MDFLSIFLFVYPSVRFACLPTGTYPPIPCQFIPVSLPVFKCFPHPASRSHLFFPPSLCSVPSPPHSTPSLRAYAYACVCTLCLCVFVRLCSCVSYPVRSSRIVRVSSSVLCVLCFMINDQWYAHRSCHVKFPTWLGAKTVVVPPRLAVGTSCRFIHPLSLRSCMVVTDYLYTYILSCVIG